MSKNQNTRKKNSGPQAPAMAGALVPVYAPLDVPMGLQAYRRGEVILYRVRGEPAKAVELLNELDRRGVNEVVALVSHRVRSEEPAEGATSDPKPPSKH